MKKSIYFLLYPFLFALALVTSCRNPTVAPFTERLAKVWVANIVKHGSTTVYSKGGVSTVTGYTSFRLSLGSSASANLTELDNNTFIGQWEVSPDEKTLTLKNLSPQPTGTNGTILYSIISVDDTKLNLVRTVVSQKTGGTVNDYSLTSQ